MKSSGIFCLIYPRAADINGTKEDQAFCYRAYLSFRPVVGVCFAYPLLKHHSDERDILTARAFVCDLDGVNACGVESPLLQQFV